MDLPFFFPHANMNTTEKKTIGFPGGAACLQKQRLIIKAMEPRGPDYRQKVCESK